MEKEKVEKKYFVVGYTKRIISVHKELKNAKKKLQQIERRCIRDNQKCMATIFAGVKGQFIDDMEYIEI